MAYYIIFTERKDIYESYWLAGDIFWNILFTDNTFQALYLIIFNLVKAYRELCIEDQCDGLFANHLSC